MQLAICSILTTMDAPWTPNKDGGNLNYEGYYFLQRLNDVIKRAHPDVMMIAEESSSASQDYGNERAWWFRI